MTSARRLAPIVAGFLLASAVPIGIADDETEELRRLVEQIARGDSAESADAADRLIERIVGPVASALGALDARPAEEQRRLRAVLSRVSAALRVRIFRAELTPAERELFDPFYRDYADLVHRLFDPNFKVRLEALSAIPLEPDTAAGLLIAARVDDEDEDVALAALDVAAELHDGVLAGRLIRYISGATQSIRAGELRDGGEELVGTIVHFIGRACRVLGDCGVPDAAPAIADALLMFGHSTLRDYLEIDDAIEALGKLGDVRAADALVQFLNDDALRYTRRLENGKLTQTLGDAALLSLLRIYKLTPEDFGFRLAPALEAPRGVGPDVTPPQPQRDDSTLAFYGFADDGARQQARQDFLRWRTEHIGAASQPTTRPAKP